MRESFTRIHIGSACETAFSFPLSDCVLSQWVMQKLLCLVCFRDSFSNALLPCCEEASLLLRYLFLGREWLHPQVEMCLGNLPNFPYTAQELRGKQIGTSQFSQHTAGILTTYIFPASLWKWYQKRIRLFFHKISVLLLVFLFIYLVQWLDISYN